MGITAIWFRGRMNLSDDIRGGSSNAPNQATSAALVSRSRQRRCHACIVHIYGHSITSSARASSVGGMGESRRQPYRRGGLAANTLSALCLTTA
jgi:hypothetical protein